MAAGSILAVTGKPKAAGKTTWATHLVLAVLNGDLFLGQPTTKSSVVYLTEQTPETFRVAMNRAGLLNQPGISILFAADAWGERWGRIVEASGEECERLGAGLLVVDTFAAFAGVSGDGENDAGRILEALRPLQRIAAKGVGVTIIHHERKSGGDVGTSARGSTALAGAVDVIASLRRPEGNSAPTIRELVAISRFPETPERLLINLQVDGYRVLGDSSSSGTPFSAEAQIRGALPTVEGEAMTAEEVAAATGMGRSLAYLNLDALSKDGRVRVKGAGKKTDPRRYWCPPSSDFSSPVCPNPNVGTTPENE